MGYKAYIDSTNLVSSLYMALIHFAKATFTHKTIRSEIARGSRKLIERERLSPHIYIQLVIVSRNLASLYLGFFRISASIDLRSLYQVAKGKTQKSSLEICFLMNTAEGTATDGISSKSFRGIQRTTLL